jgi:lysophospholipase L1-like esterase
MTLRCIPSLLRAVLFGASLSIASIHAWALPAQPVRIQLFGDSTQFGYDGRTDKQTAHPPAAVLQSLMDARFGAGAVIVTERAVPGSASAQLLAGTDGRNRPWPREVDADIVVVNHALNDAYTKVPLAKYAEQLRRLHPTVYETPNPVTVGWPSPKYARVMRQVAAEQHAPVADVETWMRAQPHWRRHLTDGLHPDDATYGEIARQVLMPTLEPLVVAAQARR